MKLQVLKAKKIIKDNMNGYMIVALVILLISYLLYGINGVLLIIGTCILTIIYYHLKFYVIELINKKK